MASQNTNILTQDIFQATNFVDDLKSKYIDIPEDTLYLGVFGFLSSYFSNLIQNTATQVSEYSLEAIPTRAKFERNILSHALALGINKITATPAQIDVTLFFPEEYLVSNMTNNRITIDKDFAFSIGERADYQYHLDYDVRIRRSVLPNGKVVYTAMYLLDDTNPFATATNPYLPALGITLINNQRFIALRTTLRQVTKTTIHETIKVDNPLETRTLTFQFSDQLAYFYVECIEVIDGVEHKHILTPIYEGLYDYKSDKEFINYMYLDEKTIRVKFNRSSYQPRYNVDVNIHVYTTLGSRCNFDLADQYRVTRTIISERFNYSSLIVLLLSESSSMYGEDRATIDDLKEFIPREALARGSYSTYTDLLTFFNLIQTENCKVKLMERVYNQIEHVYFAYLLMKYNGNIAPTNTVDVKFNNNAFSSISRDNYIVAPGTMYFLEEGEEVARHATAAELEDEETYEDFMNDGFLYTCPYLMVVNKNPFYISLYNPFVHYSRTMYFEYINDKSNLQFILENIEVYRNYFGDNDTVHIKTTLTQNMNTDYDIITYNEDGDVLTCKLAPYLVIYSKDTEGGLHPYRYIKGEIQKYNREANGYEFDFTIKTSNIIEGRTPRMLFKSGCYSVGSQVEAPAYLYPTIDAKIFILVEEDEEYGRTYGDNGLLSSDSIIPGMAGYTLTNIYSSGDNGIDIFYDYSDLMNCYVDLDRKEGDFVYKVHKVPVVRYTWLQDEETAINFFRQVDYRRRYIQQCLPLLEDSFGVNFKFYNTFGPSKCWNIDKKENVDRVNLSLKFEIKFSTRDEVVILPDIKASIKDYIENINTSDTAIHMSNCCTYIKNLYNDSLEYIKFVGLNDYHVLWQSIYHNPKLAEDYFTETQTVPEFINIHTLENGEADIEFDVVE